MPLSIGLSATILRICHNGCGPCEHEQSGSVLAYNFKVLIVVVLHLDGAIANVLLET